MIEFTCSLNALLGMAGASSSAGIKQQAANAAVHIQRGERCLNFAAQNGRLTVLFQLEDKSERLKEVCWTDDEDRIVSICFREIIGEMEKLPKIVTVHVGLTRVDITPVGDRTTKGSYCSRWRVPLQHTLFPDMTRLPRPTTEDLRELTGMTPDLDTVNLLQKTAKRLGSGMKQPRFTFFGQSAVESIGVRYGDLPSFYAVMRALPGDPMQCDPPAWLVDRDMIPGMASLSSIFFRNLSESERAEAAAGDEEPAPKKKRGRKPKEMIGQTVLAEPVDLPSLTDEEVYRRYSNAVNDDIRALYAGEWKRRQGAGKTQVEEKPAGDAGATLPTSRRLEWYGSFDDDDNAVFMAASCQTVDESPLLYRIKERNGEFGLFSEAELLYDGDAEMVFTSLDEAKAFCQAREDEAIAANAEPEQPDVPAFDDAAETHYCAGCGDPTSNLVNSEEGVYICEECIAREQQLAGSSEDGSDNEPDDLIKLQARAEAAERGECSICGLPWERCEHTNNSVEAVGAEEAAAV